ncbi:MAG TPA: sialidase family protein [Longimicrobiales bacterium]
MRTATGRAARRAVVGVVLVGALLASACGNAPPPLDLGEALTVVEAGASNPTTAADPRTGTIYVAWVGVEDGVAGVYLARSEDGRTFSAPVRVNDRPGDAAPHEQAPAQVAVGPEGHVYVVWQNNTVVEGRRFPASDLRFARSTDGGRSFEPALTVNDDAGGLPASHTFHSIAVAADGTIYVSWIDSRVRARVEAERRAGRGGAEGGELPGPEIRLARSTDGGRSFEPSVVVDEEACPCCRTALAVGPDGAVYVAWRKVFEGSVRDIVVARSTDGGRTFGAPVRVHDDGWVIDGCPHAGPSLAVDGDGRLHVAWYTGREGRQGLFHAVSEDGGRSFGGAAPILSGEWVPVSQVKLVADGRGEVWITWDDRRGEEKRVYVARAERSGPSRRGAAEAGRGASPAIAAAGDVRAVAWLDGEAVRVRAIRSGP